MESSAATAFTQSIQGTPPAAEAKAPLREQREDAAQATEDALDKALAESGVLDDGDDEDDGRGAAPKTPKRVARAVKGGGEDEDGNPDLDGDDEEEDDDEGELEELPDEDDELEDEGDEGARAEGDEDEDEDEEEAGAENDGDGDDEALERAWDKLRAAKVPMSVLKTTAREKLIAWAASLDGDEKGTDASRSGVKGESEAGRAGAASKTEADAFSLDWSAVRETLADELGLDPERAERAFNPLVQAIEKAVAAKFEKRIESAETLARTMLEARGREKIDANVRRLSKAYPRLATNPRLVEKLKEEAVTLASGHRARGEMPSAEDIFDKAASIVLGPKKREVILAQKRRNGLSSGPDRVGGRASGRHESVDGWFEEQMGLVEAGKVDRAMRNAPPKVRGRLKF